MLTIEVADGHKLKIVGKITGETPFDATAKWIGLYRLYIQNSPISAIASLNYFHVISALTPESFRDKIIF